MVAARLAGEAAGPGGRLRDRRQRAEGNGGHRRGDPARGRGGRDADVVVVSGHRGFDYAELLTAKRALDRAPPCSAPAATRRCRCPAATGPAPARSSRRSKPPPANPPRSAASPSTTCSRRRLALVPATRSGWRWSATGSPPTSTAAARPAWRRAGPHRHDRRARTPTPPRAAARPRHRRPRRAAAASGASRRTRSAPGRPLRRALRRHLLRPGRGRRGARRSCPATSAGRSAPATSRSGS